MLRNYLATFQLLLRSQQGAASGQTASAVGRQAFRRTITSQARPSIRSPASRIAHNVRPRQTVTNHVARSTKSAFRSPRRPFHNTSRLRDAKPNQKGASSQEPQGLSAKLKKLSREYGWSAVGVYLGLSVLDFPFCFLLVRIVGTDRIGELEHLVVSNVKKAIPESLRNWWHEYRKALKQAEQEQLGNDEISEHVEMVGWGVEEAEEKNKTEASLGTQLALAYAIHKTFIFVRVPLTAAITPKVVKTLRSWGWNIGKRRSKSKK
ncbi:peptide alpha-N-acetyltransferase Nat2 [Xylariomycetidae sp. FL0641]|nr:peptide alpha-N-acetyltransferase Nat2 [Xylariomycetidae sp. FL0641]